MKLVLRNDSDYESILCGLFRRAACPPEIETASSEIVNAVRDRGDRAVAEFAEKFDRVRLNPGEFRVGPDEIRAASASVSPSAKKAVRTALKNVRIFTKRTLPRAWSFSPRRGVTLGEQFTPMDRVACYVPGGTAPLVSTSIHTVAIAKTAGVKTVVAMTPPMPDGCVNPATLFALVEAGADEIYKLGGVYAVAALGFGTPTIEKAEKIVGPGNAYVAAAKKLLYGTVAIDMVAGPSEVMVLADRSANPAFVAADLLSQAEHGSGLEQAVLVSDDAELLNEVQQEVLEQSEKLSRQGPLRKVMDHGMFFIEAAHRADMARIASAYAPEHLEIQCRNPRALARKVQAAGAIFLGDWTPEPVGDFTAGPSHVLPTGGTAKFFHGLTGSDFIRRSSLVEYSRDALTVEADAICKFAELEGLDAHGNCVKLRVPKKKRGRA